MQVLYGQQTDTINIKDSNGLKQGYWIVFGESKPNSCYKPAQKVEEGYYKDNKKNGLWTEYFCNEKIKSKVEFKAGKPDGKAVMFHPNGMISETGTFVLNKWVGEYFLYFETGKPQQIFMFNESGKREGLQKHYFQNGKMQIISTYIDNKDYASLLFDTLGVLDKTILNGKAIQKGDKLSEGDRALFQSMQEEAVKENKTLQRSR